MISLTEKLILLYVINERDNIISNIQKIEILTDEELSMKLQEYKVIAHSNDHNKLFLPIRALELVLIADQCWSTADNHALELEEIIDRIQMIFDMLETETPNTFFNLAQAFKGSKYLDFNAEAQAEPLLGRRIQELIRKINTIENLDLSSQPKNTMRN